MSHYQEAFRVFEEEISALAAVCKSLEATFDSVVELCLRCDGKLVVTGIGKSGIIAHKIASTLASTGTPAVFLNAGEALHGDIGVISKNDILIMISNSAATPEIIQMLPSIRTIGAKMIGIFGKLDTSLAREVDVILNATVKQEACPLMLAPMTSSTVALVVGDALAAALMRARGFTKETFAVYHPGGNLGRRLLCHVEDAMVKREAVPILNPDQSLDDAIKALGAGKLGAVLIEDISGRLRGILVEADVRRHYLKRTLPETALSEAMTLNPKTIQPTATLQEALAKMESEGKQVYVLPVIDNQNRILGMLRMHDIVSG